MHKRNTLLPILGLVGIGVYITRRHWIARWLGLNPHKYDVGVQRGVVIPMPDGVRLVADHYYPKFTGTFPTILLRTPYGRNENGGILGLLNIFVGQRFAERGYHVIVQDTRGRFDSEGEFEPFVDEQRDGLATLKWIEQQPWFDGNVGMWGSSYVGYVQWAVAGDAPDYFKAMMPSITGTQIVPYTGNAFAFAGILRWVYSLTRKGKMLNFIIDDFIRFLFPQPLNRLMERASDYLPIGQVDEFALGERVPYFRKWIAAENARMDAPFWQSVSHRARIGDVRAATFLMGGWYDVFLHDILTDYEAMVAAGRRPYLTIGPWRHFDFATVTESLRGGLQWFDVHLKGKREALPAKPVRLFLMGANQWREYDTFPTGCETRFYLDALHSLTREPSDLSSKPDVFFFDPANPPPTLGGPLYHPTAGARDNRLLETRDDVLQFTSPRLENDLDVIGRVRLEIFARSTAPSFDIFARLCDVYPDGRSINICDGLVRVDPGIGEKQADGSVRVIVDMWATANRFRREHRLRLLIMGGQHPRWARNLGTHEPFATATQLFASENKIYHDAAHPSALVLPVVVDSQ